MKMRPLMLAVLFLLSPGQLHAGGLGGMHISHLEGDVQVAPEDSGEWVPASMNMPLREGDRLWVPEEGRAEVQFLSGTVVRLDQESAMDILRVDGSSAQFYLAQGRAYLNFWNTSAGFLQIDTPLASVTVMNRSIFMIDVADDGRTELSVLKGIVDSSSRGGETVVTAGRMLTVRDRGSTDLSSLGRPDHWEEWNRERDDRLAREGESTRYLPSELRSYAGDMDSHGRWVYIEGYDYVWTPTVIFVADWAPYRIGRWIWIGNDYVWVSYEPWGWVPYHYGRWAFVARIGWCWVPPSRGAIYWGPGYVSWVHTSAYAAWAPLAPGEIYYGYGYYGPLSVNITQVNITTVRRQAVYQNVRVRNAVTVMDRDAFLLGRGHRVQVRDNPFLHERGDPGRPRWKPQKLTRTPVIKEVPQRRLPPERLRQLPLKEVRKERPFLKEHPQARPGGEARRSPVAAPAVQKKPRSAPPARSSAPSVRTPAPQGRQEGPGSTGENGREQRRPPAQKDVTERPLPSQPVSPRSQVDRDSEKLNQPAQPAGKRSQQNAGSSRVRQPAQPTPQIKSGPVQQEKGQRVKRPPKAEKGVEKQPREQQPEPEVHERGNGGRLEKEGRPGT